MMEVLSTGWEAGAHTCMEARELREVGKAEGSWVPGGMRYFLVAPLAALILPVQNNITCSLVQLPSILFICEAFTRTQLSRLKSNLCVK